MSLHARFSASASHRWMRCPGSVKLTEGLESPSSEYAAEGTFLHEVAAELLLNWPLQHELTDEQMETVMTYVNLVREESRNGMMFVETKFKLPIHKDMWGTADCVITVGDVLKVLDFKAGRGISVEVEYGGKLNPQLGFYALGAMSALKKRDWKSIEIIVCQPRFGGVKRRTTTVEELDELAKELLEAAKKAEKKAPPYQAGMHCKFCLARGFCSTLREEVYQIARMEFDETAREDDIGRVGKGVRQS